MIKPDSELSINEYVFKGETEPVTTDELNYSIMYSEKYDRGIGNCRLR